MAPKRGLGKGLSALLSEGKETPARPGAAEPPGAAGEPAGTLPRGKTGKGETFIPLDKLKPNPAQPRKTFDEKELEELAGSIRQQGIIQPIIAEDAGDGTYIIVAGERRTRAARMAGLTEAPVILRNYSDEKRMEVSLIENIQRQNLNAIEEAAAYKHLMEEAGLSQDDVAARVGKNRATVANALRLLKLPSEMQESVKEGKLSPGHARALLSVEDAKRRAALFREILKKGLSVREAEKKAGEAGSERKKPQSAAKKRPPEIADIEGKLITRLGTKVAVNGDLKRGSLVIDYYSMDDLDRLCGIMGLFGEA